MPKLYRRAVTLDDYHSRVVFIIKWKHRVDHQSTRHEKPEPCARRHPLRLAIGLQNHARRSEHTPPLSLRACLAPELTARETVGSAPSPRAGRQQRRRSKPHGLQFSTPDSSCCSCQKISTIIKTEIFIACWHN